MTKNKRGRISKGSQNGFHHHGAKHSSKSDNHQKEGSTYGQQQTYYPTDSRVADENIHTQCVSDCQTQCGTKPSHEQYMMKCSQAEGAKYSDDVVEKGCSVHRNQKVVADSPATGARSKLESKPDGARNQQTSTRGQKDEPLYTQQQSSYRENQQWHDTSSHESTNVSPVYPSKRYSRPVQQRGTGSGNEDGHQYSSGSQHHNHSQYQHLEQGADQQRIFTSSNDGSRNGLSKHPTCKPTVTAEDGERKNQHINSKNVSSIKQKFPPKSPHSSQCLEKGKYPTSYCIKCKQWVCKECADIDHSKRGCAISSFIDALKDMKQQHVNTANATLDSLCSSQKELKEYDSQIEVYLLIMRAAFEYIEKKQKLVKTSIQDSTQIENKLKSELSKLTDAKNLPEALAQFKILDSECTAVHQWLSETLNTGNADKIGSSSKAILGILFECLQTLKTGNGTQSQIFVARDLSTGKILSELTSEGGRVHFNALTPRKTVNKGARVMPLDCIKTCLDHQSTLTFLDLSWGDSLQGRVYVRLTGDTQRGRQFVKLCTGEAGPCFRGTHFHRIWWKGLPGEHIWTGDYDKGDGSGGQSQIEGNRESQMSAEPGRNFPITAGLVAGRYEKENISSVFRIYTKGEKDVMEEAAFGQVEFGLNIIEKATKLGNISDVTISGCGVILEV